MGPEGYFPSIDRYRPQECKYERSVPYGQLIGRVDNATGFFSVGRSADRTATVSGPLWLRINDADRCLENNRGAVSVVIWIARGAPTEATR